MGRMIHLSDQEFSELTESLERVSEFFDRLRADPTQGVDHRALCSHQAQLEAACEKLELAELDPVLEQLAVSAARLATDRGIHVEWVTPKTSAPRLPFAARETVAEALVHAVRNSIAHGARALSQGQTLRLEIRWWIAGDRFGVSLTDDGAGPDEEPATAGGDASILSGRGLGLSAVKSAAERAGGAAWVQVPHPERAGSPGFALLVEVPVSSIAVEVAPVRWGSRLVLVPAVDLLENPDSNKVLFRRTDDGPPVELSGARRVGGTCSRLFRKLDVAWEQAGPAWVREWWQRLGGPLLTARNLSVGDRRPDEDLVPLLDSRAVGRVAGRIAATLSDSLSGAGQ